jgi:hypothetical protein
VTCAHAPRQPAPLPLGKANNFIDVMADRRAESAVAVG